MRNLTQTPGPDLHPDWSPSGDQSAFASGERLDREIWVMDSDGSNRRQLTPNRPGISGAPAWSPDGSQIVFESSEHQGDLAPHSWSTKACMP
ncbi:TPA: hypothetical protein DCE37_10915 [Candidatus Latescibacteria bacterium]|nr:hypothetical protein [Candidatus Latescibacterota bacterium]